ncbi:MAG: LysM domain-containing protein [Pseudomonadota bacterium]|nr:LysM domain-containing protein [Pseudomonadota bacterium]
MRKYSGFAGDGPLRPGRFAAGILLGAALGGCATQPVAPPAPLPMAPPASDPVPMTATPAAAPMRETVRLRESGAGRYVVKKGDTLWDISQYFLQDAWQWPELWYVNGQVSNPHLIYPGDVLTIAWIDGYPQLMRESGVAIERLSPQIRESGLGDAIPAIPLEAIRDFLRGPRIVSLEELNAAPYVLAFLDSRLIAGAGDGFYVKNLPRDESYTYSVVNVGDAYRDPETGDILGYEAIPTAEAEVRDYGSPSTAELVSSYRETRIGNRLLPRELELFASNFYPHSPDAELGGTIISVFDGVSQIGQYQIVAINRGTDHGLEPGHVLSIFQRGRKVKDPYDPASRVQLPDLYAGNLMIFKTDARLSYGLVMTAERPLHVLDKVDKPHRSTP